MQFRNICRNIWYIEKDKNTRHLEPVIEKSEVVTFCHGLKLTALDGKKYKTDCTNTEGIFRIIQSIPSPSYTTPLIAL